jgi:hypothetical protein
MDAECVVPNFVGENDAALELRSMADGSKVTLSGRQWPRPGLQAAFGDKLEFGENQGGCGGVARVLRGDLRDGYGDKMDDVGL